MYLEWLARQMVLIFVSQFYISFSLCICRLIDVQYTQFPVNNEPKVTLKLKTVPEKHDSCSFCGAKSNLKEFPVNERYDTFMQCGIYIPKRSKLCLNHIVDRDWSSKDDNFWKHNYVPSQLDDIFDFIRSKYLRKKQMSTATEIRIPEIKQSYIGLDENQVNTLMDLLPSLVTAVGKREEAKKYLQLYLMRLRKNMSFQDLGNHFQITGITASKRIQIARNSLTRDLVEKKFGFKNVTRAVLNQHTTPQSRVLFCDGNVDQVITIWDGTYFFCHKSGNFRFQRDTYSMQKKRNLVKPMVCVAPDGFIIDIFAPFKASDNDATILRTILRDRPEVNKVLQPSDILIVDRGFRDSTKTLKSMGLNVKMPSSVDQTDGQLTNKQANDSRLVTKLRWVVEARNGHLKTIWPFFAKQWTTYELLHLEEDVRIAANLINMFFATLIPDKANGEEIVGKMMERANQAKPVFHTLIDCQTFQKEIKNFTLIDIEHFEFPLIAEADLKYISLGTYQIKQAKRYTIEHTKSFTEIFECFECPEHILHNHFHSLIEENSILMPVLVVARLSSRHKSRANYRTFVLADNGKAGVDAISAYHCNCVNGLRTVGCCAHIMCMIRFLCHARHTGDKRCIAPYLNAFFE